MDHINNELPICSVLVRDFNARCSKECNNDITNANGRALDTVTSSAGSEQIINKAPHTIGISPHPMVLTFQYLKKVIIISSLGKLTFVFPFPRAMFVKFGIIKKLMLRVYKKLFYSDFLMGKSFRKSFC